MLWDFDLPLCREKTASLKFDGRQSYFGTADVAPLWVADMDFAVPEAITQALAARIAHPVFGYSLYPDSLYEAVIDWFWRRHRWAIERDWIVMAPGVVPSLFAAVQALTEPGDGVIVQSPVYFPFFSAAASQQRRMINNPLRESAGRYQMDFEHLALCAQQGARLLLLCSPHNPVGRVWTANELTQLLEITRRYQITILSDDIHCDLLYPGVAHTMLGRLAQPDDRIVTAIAPNKTFNIPGLGLSALVIPDAQQRRALQQVFDSQHSHNRNPLSMVAFEAAYHAGDAWLDALMLYLQETCRQVADFFQQSLPEIRVTLPEATFLLWLDCRAMGMNDEQLRRFFVEDCKLGLSPGQVFGEGGSGFMRMNIGAARVQIHAALNAIKAAWELRGG